MPGSAGRGGLPLAPPVGMGDLVQPEATHRRALGDRLVSTFGLYGYDLVATPFFEHAEVLERGLEQMDRRDLLRFVEPETGEVALLRPDITPQIARIIATRLHDRPPPWRLCYEGHVIRRQRGRARQQRQIAQAGVECVGLAGPEADVEVIALAARACEAVGLHDYRVELGQVRIGRAALDDVPEAARASAADALVHKDVAALESLLREVNVPARERRRLTALADLYGDLEVLPRARRLLRGSAAGRALDELEDVAVRLADRGLSAALVLDLGELRGQAYYTGVSFTLLAEGPGQPVGGGGRYDHLLGRFGPDAPATGFALDLGNLTWALARAGVPFAGSSRPRVVLATDAADELAEALRARGAVVAELGKRRRAEALAFARAWGYDALLVRSGGGLRAHRVDDGAARTVDLAATDRLDALLAWMRASDANANEG
ncbi:MAG: ATP phosphoribosyltransferase regulatory subunit [Myxococcota bacterium]